MPRPLVLGNGSLLISYDDRYRMREFCWPHVGLYNHLLGHSCRLGVWVEGMFAWIDEDGWERHLDYEPGTLVGDSTFTHSQLQVRLRIVEAAHPEHPWHVREINVENLSDHQREFRIFINSDFHLNESDAGDTAFYHPGKDAMIHYKRDTYILLGGKGSNSRLHQFTTAHRGFAHFHGSADDARDGELGWNPMTYGCTDSTYSVRTDVSPGKIASVDAWTVCATSLLDLERASVQFAESRVDAVRDVINASREHSKQLLGLCQPALEGLPQDIADFAEQSLLILLTQVDRDGGILAANDSDIMSYGNKVNYSNVWPRDGAFVASVLHQSGLRDWADRYFQFSQKMFDQTGLPYFLQKYWPDGSLGPGWHAWVHEGVEGPGHQQDETALTVVELGELLQASRIEEAWTRFIYPASDHIVAFRDAHGLPKPTWDLWEERKGVHIYTVATVISALRVASEIAGEVGDRSRAATYAEAAETMLAAMKTQMWDPARGCFYRRLIVHSDGSYEPDHAVDSSSMQVLLLGVLPPDDPMVVSNLQVCKDALWVNTEVGGMARYQDDYYHRVSHDLPGNPWIICTMWLAQSLIATAADSDHLHEAESLLRWAMGLATLSGVMAEQLNPYSGEPLSVSPLTWSHAEFLKAAMDLAMRRREFGL